MQNQLNGEKLFNRPWFSVADYLPITQRCVEFASHQYYGIANWSQDKGFYEVFVTAGKYEEAEYFKDNIIWNDEVMWWRNLPDWPYYGISGIDSKLMKRFETKDEHPPIT